MISGAEFIDHRSIPSGIDTRGEVCRRLVQRSANRVGGYGGRGFFLPVVLPQQDRALLNVGVARISRDCELEGGWGTKKQAHSAVVSARYDRIDSVPSGTSPSRIGMAYSLRRGPGRTEAEQGSLGLLVRGLIGDGETIPGSCLGNVPGRLAVRGKPAADDRPGFAIGGKVRQVVAEHALGFGATCVRLGRGPIADDSQCLHQPVERLAVVRFGRVGEPEAADRLRAVLAIQGQVSSKPCELGMIRRAIGE